MTKQWAIISIISIFLEDIISNLKYEYIYESYSPTMGQGHPPKITKKLVAQQLENCPFSSMIFNLQAFMSQGFPHCRVGVPLPAVSRVWIGHRQLWPFGAGVWSCRISRWRGISESHGKTVGRSWKKPWILLHFVASDQGFDTSEMGISWDTIQ